ncbi:MAG TPA: hypothetical protein VGF36_10020, partial [Rhodopila sp.]
HDPCRMSYARVPRWNLLFRTIHFRHATSMRPMAGKIRVMTKTAAWASNDDLDGQPQAGACPIRAQSIDDALGAVTACPLFPT